MVFKYFSKDKTILKNILNGFIFYANELIKINVPLIQTNESINKLIQILNYLGYILGKEKMKVQ